MGFFSALIKPASALCNMRCKYCFYYDVASHRDVNSFGLMSQATSEQLIDRIFDYVQPPSTISFLFQGGEPTMAGLDYFRHFVAYVTAKNQSGFAIQYGIQTNGYLLDEAWCAFFAEHHFLVGVSLDSYPENHDYHRLDSKLQGTHRRITQGIALLKSHHVEFNIVTVLTETLAKHPQKAFRYYLTQGFDHLQLIPCLAPLEGGKAPLTPRRYGQFMRDFFDLWFRELTEHNHYISIRQFDNLVQILRNQPPEQCGMGGFCTPNFIVEADGSVYSCDFYVLDEYRCGNIHSHSILELSQSPAVSKFLKERGEKPSMCDTCDLFPLCRGGCSRYRSFYGAEAGYCPMADFLRHAYPKLWHIARP